jgi:hypothetical protein
MESRRRAWYAIVPGFGRDTWQLWLRYRSFPALNASDEVRA